MHFCAGNLSETFLARRQQNSVRRHHSARRETDVTPYALFVFLWGVLEFYPPLFERLLAWLRVGGKKGVNTEEWRIKGAKLKISLSLLNLSRPLCFFSCSTECERVFSFSVLLNKLC